jgi:hypothetical protein
MYMFCEQTGLSPVRMKEFLYLKYYERNESSKMMSSAGL